MSLILSLKIEEIRQRLIPAKNMRGVYCPPLDRWKLSNGGSRTYLHPGVMLLVLAGGAWRQVVEARLVLGDHCQLDEDLARQLWQRWVQNGCRALTAEQAGVIMLGRAFVPRPVPIITTGRISNLAVTTVKIADGAYSSPPSTSHDKA